MEEKRRETGSPSPAATISGGSSIKSTDSPATEPPPRRRGQKRKSNTSTSTVSSAPPKRHAREKAAAAAAAASGSIFSLPPIHHGPLTRARQLSDSNAAIFSALNAIKNEASVAANEAAVAEAKELSAAQEEEMKKFESIIDGEIERIRSRGENVHVVPVAAGWFSWTNIHSIEKQTLPSFFNGKLESWTPDIYKEIRNWIMKKFHANPSTNIETKDLSELSVGDLEARQEVMEFLEHWGLINYHPSHQKDPDNVNAEQNTDAEKAEKKYSVLEKLYQFENEQSSSEFVLRANTSTAAVPSGLFPESIAEELVKQEGPAVEYHCNSCSADCSRKRYHCQKQADFDLCSECYNNGKFGSGMCPSDFILMEPAEASGSTGGKWTDQETLLLLEALELFRENWNEIAEHVATKTKAQCILHFLQMPIEDSFLDYDDAKDTVLENGEPISTNIEVPVVKDNLELPEGDTGKDSSGPAEGESGKDGPEPLASDSSKANTEPSEGKTDIIAAQPKSAQTETSNLEDVVDAKVDQGKDDDIVIKALKEAFNVAGCPLTPEDKLCFAEAGNTVMALFAFLGQLIEPGLANASARNSLKAISQSSPGSQLAEMHCFILEDPPEDPKDHIASESTTTEKIEQNTSEMAKEELKKDKEITHTENSTLLVAENPSTEGEVHEKNSDTKDDPQLAPAELGIDDSKSTEKPNEEIPGVTEKSIAKTQIMKKPSKEKLLVTEKPNEEKSQVPEKSDEEKSQVTEKPDEEKSQVAETPFVEKLKVAEKHDDITNNEEAGPKSVDDPQKNEQSSAIKKHKVASGSEPENLKNAAESSLCTNGSKDSDIRPTSVVSDKTERQEPSGAVPMVGVSSEAGEDKMDVDKKEDTKNTKPTCTKDEDNVAKLKRAALATLSAAAVKAKLLANQEEDEIRQLATVLIEKQMRKLEIKLSYFNDMDNAISRVREQLERSRQKLFNERAQIIASRLGIPPSSRMLPSSYPINRMPPGFVNSMMRPPMNLGAQRPPIARPVVTSAPPTANPSASPERVGGNAAQPPAMENPSVETN